MPKWTLDEKILLAQNLKEHKNAVEWKFMGADGGRRRKNRAWKKIASNLSL